MRFSDRCRRIMSKLYRRRNYKFMKDNPAYAHYFIGEYTYGSPQVRRWGETAVLTVGKFCSISADVIILLGGNHRTEWVSTYPFPAYFDEFAHIKDCAVSKGDVVIGHDVWIGTGALILSGVRIGEGAVIAAGSVVVKDVEPYAIAAGNPARTVKMRFDQVTIDRLLKIKWWDWDIQRIKDKVDLLLSSNVKDFLESADGKTLA